MKLKLNVFRLTFYSQDYPGWPEILNKATKYEGLKQ